MVVDNASEVEGHLGPPNTFIPIPTGTHTHMHKPMHACTYMCAHTNALLNKQRSKHTQNYHSPGPKSHALNFNQQGRPRHLSVSSAVCAVVGHRGAGPQLCNCQGADKDDTFIKM